MAESRTNNKLEFPQPVLPNPVSFTPSAPVSDPASNLSATPASAPAGASASCPGSTPTCVLASAAVFAPDSVPAVAQASSSASAQAPVPTLAPTLAPVQAAGTPSRPPEFLMHKNRLQQYTQRASLQLPIYHIVNEGFHHAPQFRATVLVDGAQYTSPNTFAHRKAAEQDVARLALECISQKIKDEGCPFINEDTVFCKSILNEFAVKMKLEMPMYTTVQPQGLLPVFKSSLVFNGVSYTGDTGRTKKEAEQLAARTVILSQMGNSESGRVLSEIIKSKAKLYTALNKMKDLPQAQYNFVPLGVHTGHGSEKLFIYKKVETAMEDDNVPKSATTQTASGTDRHEFKMPQPEAVSDTVNLPIAFVPPVLDRALDVGTSSTKKRKKNKKKSNKKLRVNDQLPAVPLSQASPCSVAQ